MVSYSSVTTGIENVDSALGGQGLGAGYDALGAMDYAPTAREASHLWRRAREEGGGGQRHPEC